MNESTLDNHKKILGILYIITGLLTILAMMLLHAIFTMIYAFAFAEADPDEQAVFQFIMAIGRYVQLFVFVAVGAPTVIAGIGLLMRQGWAMILALIVACFKLFAFPVGTAIGVYAIWIYAEDQKFQRLKKTPQTT